MRAALARIRQERARPLVPSIVLRGEGPGGFTAGLFASGAHGNGNPTMARSDVGVELLWTVENLGFGNRALVRERRAEQQQLLVELFRRQDLVAAEVVRAHVAVKSAGTRAARAESGLQEAQRAYADSLAELGKTTQVGDGRVLTRRAFEVVDALLALRRAYDAYYQAANDYNRAQFQLYRALGYPAAALACGQVPGGVLPVDTTRPPLMAPVGARRCS